MRASSIRVISAISPPHKCPTLSGTRHDYYLDYYITVTGLAYRRGLHNFKCKHQKKQPKNPPEMGFWIFFLRFFIVNHLVDYLDFTLSISMHF